MISAENELILELLQELWIVARDGFRRAVEDLGSDMFSPKYHRAQGQKDAYRIIYTVMASGKYKDICHLYVEDEEQILVDSRTGEPK